MSPAVAAKQPREAVEVLLFCLFPVHHMRLWSENAAFLVQSLVCSLKICIWFVLSISLLGLILSSQPSVPLRRSTNCVCSKVTIFCGMVSFTTGLTGWEDRSWFSVISVVCIVRVDIVGHLIVGVRVCLNTVIVVVVVAGTIRVVLGLVFFSFALTALVSKVTWLFAVVTSWFEFFWILLSGFLRYNFYLQLNWSFQTVLFHLLFKM